MSESTILDPERYHALIFDLDGVVTRTADLHAQAWKRMFDSYFHELKGRGRDVPEFDVASDYTRYVDGKPRYRGVQSLLEARGINLPYGSPSDPPERETVCGLGNRKNRIFHQLLEEKGAELFPDGASLVRRARESGLRVALVTSSRNGRNVLKSVNLTESFEVIQDGNDAAREKLTGKPSPDIFLAAARKLGVPPQKAVVFEDAISGVQAGKAGDFGLVIGVDRVGGTHERDLLENGADRVFSDLDEIRFSHAPSPEHQPPSALDILPRIEERAAPAGLSVFLDYDGTLTPIVPRPEDAKLAPSMRETVCALASRCLVGIVSGRDLDDVRSMVALENVVYAGDHGFNILTPENGRFSPAEKHLPLIRNAAGKLKDLVSRIPGAWLEQKTYTLSVHFRETPEDLVSDLLGIVEKVAGDEELRLTKGKKVFELRPGMEWDKGMAISWLRRELGLESTFSLYIGDDTTDEDGFKALGRNGMGILVTDAPKPTAARALLADTEQVERFLSELIRVCDKAKGDAS